MNLRWNVVVVLAVIAFCGCENKPAMLDSAVDAIEAQDYTRAMAILTPLAGAGDPDAEYLLGMVLVQDAEGPDDLERAFQWFLRAAEHGNTEAQFRVGRLLWLSDPQKAIPWYEKAAEEGHPKALLYLGFAYSKGRGVAKGPEVAIGYFKDAAERGDRDAQFLLAKAYSEGEGIEQDREEAIRWYRRAAEGGNPDAPFELGTIYSEDKGGYRDPVEAYMWFSVAPPDDERAAPARESLKPRLTKPQIAAAVERAVRWEQAHPLIQDEFRALERGELPVIP